jgi:hypothetical protein
MKRGVWLLVILLSLGSVPCIAEEALMTEIIGDILTEDNSYQVLSYKNTCESVAVYLMASIIRHDEQWKEVASETEIPEIERKINELYSTFKINKFQVQKQELIGNDSLWLTVFFEVEREGEIRSGSTQMTLRYENMKWKVSHLPL